MTDEQNSIGGLVDRAIKKEKDGDLWKLVLSGDLPFSRIQPIGGSMTIVSSDCEGVVNVNGNMAKQIIYGLMQEAFEMGRAASDGLADPTPARVDVGSVKEQQ